MAEILLIISLFFIFINIIVDIFGDKPHYRSLNSAGPSNNIALNFPSLPNKDDRYVDRKGCLWTYNGTTWLFGNTNSHKQMELF